MFKIVITKWSKGVEQIVDVKLCKTRNEAEAFIKECKALPKEYEVQKNCPSCFYDLSHR